MAEHCNIIVVEHYAEMGPQPPALLDLGCGTGLELEEIFKCLPNLSVTGIDLTEAMLDKLRE